MNTKFCFLLLIALLSVKASSSLLPSADKASFSYKEIRMSEETASEYQQTDQKGHSETNQNIKHKDELPPQPEDGKHHHLDITRFENSRRRKLNCFFCKAIVLLCHVCLLVHFYMHLVH